MVFHIPFMFFAATMQKLSAFAFIDKIEGCNQMSLIFDDDVFNTLS